MSIDKNKNGSERAASGSTNVRSRSADRSRACNDVLASRMALHEHGGQDDEWERRMKLLNPHWHPYRYSPAEIG